MFAFPPIRIHARAIANTVKNIANPTSFDRRYPLTYDDFLPLGYKHSSQLPVTVRKSGWNWLRIPVGKESEDSDKYLIISTSSPIEPNKLTVTVNGKHAEYCLDNKADLNVTPNNSYTFKFISPLYDDAVVWISSEEKMTIEIAG